jgi:hypothetical protein
MIPYTFHRQDGFYVLELEDDDAAITNGICNPGTIKIINEITHKVIWGEGKNEQRRNPKNRRWPLYLPLG